MIETMQAFAAQVLMLFACCALANVIGCDVDLKRREVGSACTRVGDCMAHLDCIAGECRISSDSGADATSADAATTDAQK